MQNCNNLTDLNTEYENDQIECNMIKCNNKVRINAKYCELHLKSYDNSYIINVKICEYSNILQCFKKVCIIESYKDDTNKTNNKKQCNQKKIKKNFNNIKDDEDEKKYNFICNNNKCLKGFNIKNGKSGKCEKCYLTHQKIDIRDILNNMKSNLKQKKLEKKRKLNNYDISHLPKLINKHLYEDLFRY